MRVLLVTKEMIVYERQALAALGAVLKQRGHEVRGMVALPLPVGGNIIGQMGKLGTKPKINQMDLDGIPADVYETVRDFRPDVIGYTMMTGEANYLIKLNRKLKQHFNFCAVLGGPHPQFYHKALEEEGVDAICTGEGDISFPEFIESLDAGKDFWLTETFHVKHEGKIYRNSLGPLVEDLDTLPNPDRKMLYDIDPTVANLGTKHFFTARGCPLPL